MGSTREEQDRVRSLLLDTVTLLCKNGLNFKKQLKVQGLLGITLDEDDVFIVHINEKVGELIVEHHKKDDSDESSIDSTPAKVHRKRRSDSSPMYRGPPDKIRIKTEKEEPSEDDLILIDENQCDDKSKIQKTIIQQQQPGLHSITNFQGGYQPFNQQNNMQTGPGYMTSSNILPHQNMPQTGQPTPEKHLPRQFDRFQGALLDLGFVPRRERSSQMKNYNCKHPNCDKKYYDKSSLYRHYRDKHKSMQPEEIKESDMLNSESSEERPVKQSSKLETDELLNSNNPASSRQLKTPEFDKSENVAFFQDSSTLGEKNPDFFEHKNENVQNDKVICNSVAPSLLSTEQEFTPNIPLDVEQKDDSRVRVVGEIISTSVKEEFLWQNSIEKSLDSS